MRGTLVMFVVAILACSASAAPILIDLGGSDGPTSPNWNNMSAGVQPGQATINDMIDSTGALTGVKIEIIDAFAGVNTSGTTDAGAAYPATATRDTFFTGFGDNLGTLLLSNLDPSSSYTFTMFASRLGGGNRESQYDLVGLNSDTVALDAAYNVTNTVTTAAITPNASGQITLSLSPGPNNDTGFAYVGVIEISEVPEPATLALLAMGGLALIRRKR